MQDVFDELAKHIGRDVPASILVATRSSRKAVRDFREYCKWSGIGCRFRVDQGVAYTGNVKIQFKRLSSERDIDGLRGQQYTHFLEELGLTLSPEAYKMVKSRLRSDIKPTLTT